MSNEVYLSPGSLLVLFRVVLLLCPELVLANALTHLKQRMETGREVIVMKCAFSCVYEYYRYLGRYKCRYIYVYIYRYIGLYIVACC